MGTIRYDFHPDGPTPAGQAAPKLLYISISKYDRDWNSLLHTHACAEIFFVLGGTGEFHIQNTVHRVSAGDMIVVNPNVAHAEISFHSAPLEYIVVGVDGLEFQVSSFADSTYYRINLQKHLSKAAELLRYMLCEAGEQKPGYETVCQNLLEILVVQLLRQPDFRLTASPAAIPPGKRSSRECAQIKRYIDSHFKENISLDLLAETTHLNKYYLAHAFSQEFGISPISYLVLRRIEESKRLLLSTDHSLSQISHMLGFSSPSYFSQSFRRIVGMSPMEFRKNGLQEK